MKTLSRKRIWTARFVALVADGMQLALFPFFTEGFLSPLDDALDVGVCVLLTWLVGWHWSFIPTFFVKVVPFVDEIPTWTLAVLFATHGRQSGPPTPPPISRPPTGSQPPLIQAPPQSK